MKPMAKRAFSRAKLKLSIVVTMYNEEDSCDLFFNTIIPIITKITEDFEIVCVNDGSLDGTFSVLQRYCQVDDRIKVVSLTRNFGKELALTAGLDYVSGDVVIPIDADLQDPPDLIPALVDKWREGFDVVVARRVDRRSDSFVKRITAKAFYAVANMVNEQLIPPDTGDFRLMDRRVVEAIRQLPERTRFMKGLFAWLGFSQASIPYTRAARSCGKSKWKYWKLWNLALEGIFSFSTLPLRLWMYLGFLIGLFSGAYIVFILVKVFLFGIDVPGYASIFVSILFFSGINMISLGIIGEYLGRVLKEVKQRPLYLVDVAIGFDSDADILSHPATVRHRRILSS